MRKVTLITIAILLIVSVTVAFGFGIPKLKGTLKKTEKELKLGDIGFKQFEGTDNDPFKAAPYKYNVYGDAEFDTFFTSSHKIVATMKFANKMMDSLYAKVDAAKDQSELDAVKTDAESLQKAVAGLVAESVKLVASGAALVKNAPGKFKANPIDLKEVGNLTKDLNGAIEGLKTAGDGAKTMTDKFGPLFDKIKEKGASFAG